MTVVFGIMPTRGRRDLAPQALECFLSQDYPERMLIIRDDEDDPSFPDGADQGSVIYMRGKQRNIPEKLNELCAAVPEGAIICRFDSDDWSAPGRITAQVRMLEQSGKAVCGFNSMLFVSETARQAWMYRGARDYALGTSLCFTQEFWRTNPWLETRALGSDNVFVMDAQRKEQIVSRPADGLMFARVHKGNSNPKRPKNWKPAEYPILAVR